MKVYILTFGCKVNHYESDAIYQLLDKTEYIKSNNEQEADIIIFNSCAVTSESNRKLRQCINRIKKINPKCITMLIGCIPQAFPDRLDQFDDIDIILGNFNKNNLNIYLYEFLKDQQKIKIRDIKKYNQPNFEKFPLVCCSERTRAFLKIEDGCNRYCSYCIIPYARGSIRSKTISDIYFEAHQLAYNGYKEIVLVGINLASYGIDINSNLQKAVNVLCEIKGIERIRLGSLEPDMINDNMILEFYNLGKKFCHQFHLPLQSGSDKVLKSMRRRYSVSNYIEVVSKIRNKFEDAEITTDIMVGFPGESEEDFNKSLKIIKQVGFLKVHVFPYSPRPGTVAAQMKNQITKNIKSSRVKTIIKEGKRQSQIVLNKYIGKCVYVLYESRKQGDFFEGYTSNYLLVVSKSSDNIKGKILLTLIEKCEEEVCVGKIIKS